MPDDSCALRVSKIIENFALADANIHRPCMMLQAQFQLRDAVNSLVEFRRILIAL
jgi:hypothetical protein